MNDEKTEVTEESDELSETDATYISDLRDRMARRVYQELGLHWPDCERIGDIMIFVIEETPDEG